LLRNVFFSFGKINSVVVFKTRGFASRHVKVVLNIVAKAAIQACEKLPIKAILVATKSGATARLLSSYRGQVPIHARASTKRVVRELALSYGVYPKFMAAPKSVKELTVDNFDNLVEYEKLQTLTLTSVK